MELTILFGCLKLISLGFQIWKHWRSQKENEQLVKSLENLNQRLIKLESTIKKLDS